MESGLQAGLNWVNLEIDSGLRVSHTGQFSWAAWVECLS